MTSIDSRNSPVLDLLDIIQDSLIEQIEDTDKILLDEMTNEMSRLDLRHPHALSYEAHQQRLHTEHQRSVRPARPGVNLDQVYLPRFQTADDQLQNEFTTLSGPKSPENSPSDSLLTEEEKQGLDDELVGLLTHPLPPQCHDFCIPSSSDEEEDSKETDHQAIQRYPLAVLQHRVGVGRPADGRPADDGLLSIAGADNLSSPPRQRSLQARGNSLGRARGDGRTNGHPFQSPLRTGRAGNNLFGRASDAASSSSHLGRSFLHAGRAGVDLPGRAPGVTNSNGHSDQSGQRNGKTASRVLNESRNGGITHTHQAHLLPRVNESSANGSQASGYQASGNRASGNQPNGNQASRLRTNGSPGVALGALSNNVRSNPEPQFDPLNPWADSEVLVISDGEDNQPARKKRRYM